MKKWIFVFYFFSLFSIEPEPQISAGEYIVINLGENCSARAALEAFDIKQESYPFDSCIVPFNALIRSLSDDFRYYTHPEYFTPYFDQQSPINKYGVVLAHNFPLVSIGKKDNGDDLLVMDPAWRSVLPTVVTKFDRRIARFRAACLSSKKVCFFRYLDITYEKAKELSELIHSLYPSLDFVLICVNNKSSSYERSWNLPRVKNYAYYSDTATPKEEWKRIFKDANLYPH